MGEESDADWQDGLVEAGIADAERWFEEKLTKAFAGKPRRRRQTALRVRGRSFETVELDDAGNIIEPVRCICGRSAIVHRSNCPFFMTVT